MQGGDVGVHGGGEDGRGFFGARAAEDHGEEAGGLAGEVAGDGGVEGAVVGGVVGLFDGVEVGVGTGEEDIVEEGFAGAEAGEGFVEEEDVLLERAAEDGEEGGFEVVGGLGGDVGFEVSMDSLLVG